jgi:hypothetical protein
MVGRAKVGRSLARTGLALLAAVVPLGLVTASSAVSSPAGAAATPQCTFDGSTLPIVTKVSDGKQVAMDCTGLPALHPYLVLETSLLLGIDPKASALLTGNIASLSGLLSLLNALPEINPAALSFVTSDLSGDLDVNYTLPSSQASDPNAVCPPTKAEINDGLIGCALATIDLTSYSPVGAASAVLEYAGDSLFPPSPTLALGSRKAPVGGTVSVSDKPNAKTHWWVATLVALEALLGSGTSAPPTIVVKLSEGKGSVPVPAANDITVSPAVYQNSVLTPPLISGTFTVPPGVSGRQIVTVTYLATLLGFPLSNVASSPLAVQS